MRPNEFVIITEPSTPFVILFTLKGRSNIHLVVHDESDVCRECVAKDFTFDDIPLTGLQQQTEMQFPF